MASNMEGETRKGLGDCDKENISKRSKILIIIVGNKGTQELMDRILSETLRLQGGKPSWTMTTVRVWPWVDSSDLSGAEGLWS